MIYSGSEQIRQRLRRLVASRENAAQQSQMLMERLRSRIAGTSAALARLKSYSGPQSAELFRLSFLPVKAEACTELISGVECLQLQTQNDSDGLLPRFTSLLTSPQNEWAYSQTEEMAKALWAYVNSVLVLRALDCRIRHLRRQLRRAEDEKRQQSQKALVYHFTQIRNFENARYYWRFTRHENTDYGARQTP